MIEYFLTDPVTGSLAKAETEQPGCWIALFEPTKDEIAATARRFAIDEDDLRAPLDLEEVSRIESTPDYTMFIVDTPMHDKSSGEKRYTTIPIGIYEAKGHVISVCSIYKVPIINILKARQRKLHDTGDIKGFTCDILLASSIAYFNSLRAVNRRRLNLTRDTERPSRRDLEELYALDASLVYIRTSLATNDTILGRYRRSVLSSHDEEIIELFDDVIIEHRQALDTTKLYSEILDSTINHFGLMMNHDLNHTMQLLATLTLVLCVPTVVGGMFGMNLDGIPLAGSPYGFAVVTGVTAVVLAVLMVVLKKLRWF